MLLWTLVLAVLTVKVSGAHVHLCMDGQEPPAAVHIADLHDDEHHQDEGQADKDVNPLVGTLAKKGGPEFDVALAVALTVLSWELPVAKTGVPAAEPDSLPTDDSFYWRPPLRGPPA
ncbi:hypothetical protein JM946_11915 [Steroidobacter sp. S1-65]|uniref:Uncharacterized protein n=1 Tax=Steroidobacter gossypii TaxID=2805490 RepID=A0ABS1WWW8_9GAMM|nr:hypothetical protein [Steroidobacter gossypii]